MTKGKCRSCGAPVLWVPSATSRATVILDAEPVEGGNVILLDGKARVIPTDLFEESLTGPLPAERYLSHFATCPQASKHRKRK